MSEKQPIDVECNAFQEVLQGNRRRSRSSQIAKILLLCLGVFFFLSPHFRFCTKGSKSSPLDPALKSHCESILDVPNGYYTERLGRLTSVLEQHEAVWIAEPGPSAMYHLGGFSKSDWFLSERAFLVVVRHTGEVILLTPEFEELRAHGVPISEEIKVTWVSWQEDQSPYQVLLEYLNEDVKVTFDSAVRNMVVQGLEFYSGVETLGLDVVHEVSTLRERKDEREVGLLKCANQMTLHALRETRKRMYIGIKESETRTILNEELENAGLEGEGGLVLFGENAALPHGSGTDRKLGKSDFALIDVGGTWGGYVADITRTFALPDSKISKDHLEVWETVRKAQYAPYDLLKSRNTSAPPALGGLDKAARSVIADKYAAIGYTIFTHRLGHGIGLEGHESPYLVPNNPLAVQSGITFSLEPGIYIPSSTSHAGLSGIGVRLEDCFVVTEKDGELGGEWLTGPVQKWGDI